MNFSIISYLFWGIVKQTTTCFECKNKLYNFQYFHYLSFPLYNYAKGNIKATQQCTNTKHLNEKIHQHPIMRILREQTYLENKLRCNFCRKDIKIPEEFYYCSLCNYCICLNCYQQKNQFN